MTYPPLPRAAGSLVLGAALAAVAAVPCAATAAPATARAPRAAPTYMDARHAVVPRALAVALYDVSDARAARGAWRKIPSFARQTKLACVACHYQFLELTPFGRRFKLNGYTLSGLQGIPGRSPGDSTGESLRLAPIPPASAMAIASFTRVRTAVPGTQNAVATFPDQLSLFLGGAVTPKVGAFTQFTYAAPDGSIGIDNVDLRFANLTMLGSKELIFGVTLHNNPTVQDVWNTVPAWGFPFVGSPVAPSPAASPLVDGVLGQQVLGLGAYGFWNDLLYGELTAYRSAPQGGAQPADSTATNTTRNVAPYWRVALQHQLGDTYVMVGTYGMAGEIYPTGVTGPTNRYTDVAADAQVERPLGDASAGRVLIVRSTVIHEKQRLDASVAAAEPGAANATNTLTTFRVNASFQPSGRYDLSLGYFDVSGTRDPILYPPDPVTGSASGRPNSSGVVGELDYNPWQNVRVGAQYTAYGRFNGASSSYDGAGRRASDNNTLYVFTWLVF
jgi:hypothetical protein